MPARNPETSYCEIQKAVFDGSGVAKIREIVDVVQGADRAADAVDRFERHMTQEDRQAGIIYRWSYTSRGAWQSWRLRRSHRLSGGRFIARRGAE